MRYESPDVRCAAVPILLVGMAVAFVLAAVSIASAASEDGFAVQQVDTSGYPRMAVRVILPPVMLAGGTLHAGDFRVRENGSSVAVGSVTALSSGPDPLYVVLVIDTSGSMKGKALDDAKAAASRFVEALGPPDRVAVIAFNDAPRSVSGFSGDKAAVTAAIAGLLAARETAVYDAISAAVAQFKDVGKAQKAVLLLSDGGDTMSSATLDSTAQALAEAGVPLHAVALQTREYNLGALQSLTRSSGGTLVSAQDSAQLSDLFAGVARQLQSPYEVTFTSLRPPTKDLEIDVTVSSRDLRASASAVAVNPDFAAAQSEPAVTPTLPSSGWPLGIAAAVFLVVTMFSAAVLLAARPEPNTLRQLTFYEQLRKRGTTDVTDPAVADPDSLRGRLLQVASTVAAKGGFEKAVGAELERAGLPLRPVEYMTLHSLFVLVFGLAVQVVSRSLPLSMCAVVVLALAPVVLLRYLAAKRLEAFEEQLPDVLNLLAGSLRAGWGLLQAIGIVVTEMSPPTGPEFARVATEARLGLPLEEALSKMAERVGSDDFRWAVTAISIQREVGGNLAEVLDIVSSTVRERAALRRQVSSLTAEGRLSAYILIALPFVEAAALFMLNPGYMVRITQTPVGLVLAGIAVVLLIAGAIWLRNIVKIEV